jgi:Cof subfamily protein (haloacid dehalogenase superfamily)
MSYYFFIDYDNTLFSHYTGIIPDSAFEALRRLKQDGHKLILSSGRNLGAELDELKAHGIIPDATAGANGAILKINGETIHTSYLDPDVQHRLLDFAKERGYCLVAGYEGEWYASNPERMTRKQAVTRLQPDIKGAAEFEKLRDVPMMSFFLDDTDEAIADLAAHFPELKLLRMAAKQGGADVVPKENGKAQAMKQLLDAFGATLSDAVAIGDSMNDIEMIKAAGLGIAMGNAMEEVQLAADYVAKHIDDDGLADAISYALTRKNRQ